jgi:hypothetical protein
MANSVMQSLFGNILGAPEQSQTQAIRDAYKPYDAPGSLFQGAIRGAGAELQASVGSAFGQEPVEVAQKRKLQAIVQSAQQEADLSTPEGLGKLAEKMNQFPEFSGIALSLRQQAAQMKQEGQLKQAQTAKALAEADKAMREKTEKVSLAEQLVNLQEKEATEGLTAPEAARKEALERVVKIQSPKGVDLTGFAQAMTKKSAEEEGKELGKALSTITGKQQAIDSIDEAMKYLKKGIYSGKYGELQKEITKGTLGVIGDEKRVVNTETFLAEISNTVIPMLKEFGGNDSNEELRFLQRVVGGDISLQEKSIENILTSAKKKINKGIEKLRVQSQALKKGESPSEAVMDKKTSTRTTKSGVTYTVEE